MTTYQCIGGPLDGETLDLLPSDMTPPCEEWSGSELAMDYMLRHPWRYLTDHANRRLIYEGLYEADAIKAERST